MKSKKCKSCGQAFIPFKPMQSVCGIDCAISEGNRKNAIKMRKLARQERKDRVQKLKDMRTLPQLKAEAQKAFNAFIRARDAGKPCISCGNPLPAELLGGAFDCGHYRSVGSAPHLRFVEENAHGQCKYCNRHLSGNHVAYRQGLVVRIGLDAVERIESDQEVKKYTHNALLSLAAHYRLAKKQIKEVS